MLQNLLKGTFARCREYARDGKPLGELLGEKGELHSLNTKYDTGKVAWEATKSGSTIDFKIRCRRTPGAKNERFYLFFVDPKGEVAPWNIIIGHMNSMDSKSAAIVEEYKDDEFWYVNASMAYSLIGIKDRFCFGCEYVWNDDERQTHSNHYPDGEFENEQLLNIGFYTPDRPGPVKF